MWQKTAHLKQIDIHGTRYTLTQIVASDTFFIKDRRIEKGTLGGWVDDNSVIAPTFFCDTTTLILDSTIDGNLYVQQSTLLSSHIHAQGLITQAQLYFCTIKSAHVHIQGNLELTAVRTSGDYFTLHSSGKLHDCAFNGNVHLTTATIAVASSEWHGQQLTVTGSLRLQQSHLLVKQLIASHITLKRCQWQLHHVTIQDSELIKCELQGVNYTLRDAHWSDCDIAIQTLHLTTSDLEDVIIFSPLGHLQLVAPLIFGADFSVHVEKIDVALKSTESIQLTKELLF